mgnify:CR=1 FL=1
MFNILQDNISSTIYAMSKTDQDMECVSFNIEATVCQMKHHLLDIDFQSVNNNGKQQNQLLAYTKAAALCHTTAEDELHECTPA